MSASKDRPPLDVLPADLPVVDVAPVRRFPHILHLVLTVLTCGLWSPVWLLHYVLTFRGGRIAVACVVGAPLLLGTLLTAVVVAVRFRQTEAQARAIEEADQLYAAGRHAEAIVLYKQQYAGPHSNKAEIARRIIEHELDTGHADEARQWMEKAIEEKLEIAYVGKDAKQLATKVRKDLETKSSAQTSSKEGAEVIRRQATVLLAEYQANEAAADRQYKGTVLEVTGVVDQVGKDLRNQVYVTLKSDNKEEGTLVQCFAAASMEADLQKLRPGQTATVRGTCGGRPTNVVLQDSVVAP
jgi:hypothetical protein